MSATNNNTTNNINCRCIPCNVRKFLKDYMPSLLEEIKNEINECSCEQTDEIAALQTAVADLYDRIANLEDGVSLLT